MSMWLALISEWYPEHTFAPGALEAEIAEAERALAAAFPAELRDLLRESNGVFGEFKLDVVWSTSSIVEANQRVRTAFADIFMPFDALLFFAGAGNGDYFGFPVVQGVCRPDVFVWNHEDDSRASIARDLRDYLERWADGRLKV